MRHLVNKNNGGRNLTILPCPTASVTKTNKDRQNLRQRQILMKSATELNLPKPCRFTEVNHNDKPFRIVFVKDFKKAKPVNSAK